MSYSKQKHFLQHQKKAKKKIHFELFHSILEQMMNCHSKTVSSNTQKKSLSLRIAYFGNSSLSSDNFVQWYNQVINGRLSKIK